MTNEPLLSAGHQLAQRRFFPYLKTMEDGRKAVLLDERTGLWRANSAVATKKSLTPLLPATQKPLGHIPGWFTIPTQVRSAGLSSYCKAHNPSFSRAPVVIF